MGLYIVQGAESEKSERVVYVTKHLLDADVAKYNCAMLVIYSRWASSPECMMVRGRGPRRRTSPERGILNRVHNELA